MTQDNTLGAAWMLGAPEIIWTCSHVGEYGRYFPEAVEAEGEYGGKALPYRISGITPTLSDAMKLPEVAALVDAVTQELGARLTYEATPTGRGGNSGLKGTALSSWIRARATVAVALAPFTAAKETKL